MATVRKIAGKKGKNRYKIQFLIGTGLRVISFDSKFTYRQVEKYSFVVDDLARCVQTGGTPNKSTITMVEEMPPSVRKKFERAGLLAESEELTLGELCERFMKVHAPEVKDSTLTTYKTVLKRFFRFFDSKSDPNSITDTDGYEWKNWLKDQKYSKATGAGCIQRMRTVFNWATEKGFVKRNPFKKIPKGSFVNEKRHFNVSIENYQKLLDACPDQCWRMILAFCRIAALRCPSEILTVTWEDVHWNDGELLVYAEKTEKCRTLPLFPLLREELERSFELAKPVSEGGSIYVIDRWRDSKTNLRTQLKRIALRAGLNPNKINPHNLRRSREKELFEDPEYDVREVCRWLGHSLRTALTHYATRGSKASFERALREDRGTKIPQELTIEPTT